MILAFGRVRIVSVRPGFTKFRVAALDTKFGALINGDLATALYCFRLRIEALSEAAVAFPTDAPSIAIPHYVLIFSSHFPTLFVGTPSTTLDLWARR